MNDDTTPMPATPDAPRAPHRRRTMLLVGAAAALGLTALGVTSAVAASSGDGDRTAPTSGYDTSRGTEPAQGPASKEGDAPQDAPQQCGEAAPPVPGDAPRPGPGDGGGKSEDGEVRPSPKDRPAPPAPKDGVKPPKSKDGVTRPAPPTPPVVPDTES